MLATDSSGCPLAPIGNTTSRVSVHAVSEGSAVMSVGCVAHRNGGLLPTGVATNGEPGAIARESPGNAVVPPTYNGRFGRFPAGLPAKVLVSYLVTGTDGANDRPARLLT